MKCVSKQMATFQPKKNGNLNSKNEVGICDSKHRCDEQFGLLKVYLDACLLTMLRPFRNMDRSAAQYHKNVKGSNYLMTEPFMQRHEKACSKVVWQCINIY